MDDNTINAILEMTKYDLQIANTSMDGYIRHLIQVADRRLERKGIRLDYADIEDLHLVVMFASYLYRKRDNNTTRAPEMLNKAINDRLFSQKGRQF